MRRATAPPIPPPRDAQVWIDFDGTITRTDVIDELIRRFAVEDSWRAAEAEWQAGRIGSRDCLARQLAVVRVSDADLDPFLDTIELDPGLGTLFALLGRHDVPVAVLSDGLDRLIRPLLARADLGGVAVRCNRFVRGSGDRVALACPHGSDGCVSASAHCKCASMADLTTRPAAVYIGDGRSDLCPARRVGTRFAKGTLAASLDREGLHHHRFDTLADVAAELGRAWTAGDFPAGTVLPPAVGTR